MIAIAMASLLVAASEAVPAQLGVQEKEPVRYCRALVAGVSRSSDVKICRTKLQWSRYDSCTGATRYCNPAQRASLGKNTAFPMNDDARIVCRMLKATGSRLTSQRTCLPQREWQRMWDDSRAMMGSLQDRYSTLAEEPR